MKQILAVIFMTVVMGHAAAYQKSKKPKSSFSPKSYIIADENGSILHENGSDIVRSIASITKLVISLIATNQDLTETLAIPKKRQVSTSIPKNVISMSREDLLTLALVKSDNLAAQVLCTNVDNCVKKMNETAFSIGMLDTHFEEPTGLDDRNVSTASDLLKLMLAAFQNHTVSRLSSMPHAVVRAGDQTIKVWNTNPLTLKFDIVLSKTGFTQSAGGCIVMMMNTSVGNRILILLGSRDVRTRIQDMERLVKQIG